MVVIAFHSNFVVLVVPESSATSAIGCTSSSCVANCFIVVLIGRRWPIGGCGHPLSLNAGVKDRENWGGGRGGLGLVTGFAPSLWPSGHDPSDSMPSPLLPPYIAIAFYASMWSGFSFVAFGVPCVLFFWLSSPSSCRQ